MNGYVIAGLLVLCVATGFLSYWRGYEHGELAANDVAAQHVQAATQAVITEAHLKVQLAVTEAQRLRKQAAQLEVAHERTTVQLRTLVEKLSQHDSCLTAPVPADILHELDAARSDAATRAATGTTHAAVPAAGTTSPATHPE